MNKGSRELGLSWYKSCDLNSTGTDTHFQLEEQQNDVDWVLILPGQTFNRLKKYSLYYQHLLFIHALC
jgi:hypothetical protein